MFQFILVTKTMNFLNIVMTEISNSLQANKANHPIHSKGKQH